MSKIDDILKTFELAELNNSNELMSNVIYSKIQKNKQNKNNLLSFAVLSFIIVVLNVAVYNSVYKNHSFSDSKSYSKEEIFKDISNELLVNSSQQK